MQRPVAWCGLNDGEPVEVCAACGCFLPGESAQLRLAPLPRDDAGCTCSLGCGERYCGATCREAAAPSHKRLCVGPHGEDHALYRFKLAAFSSGSYVDFLLAAKVAVSEEAEACWAEAGGRQPWWELRPAGLEEGAAAEYAQDAREVADDTWQMLSAGAGLHLGSERTVDDWGRLLSYVAAEKTIVSRPSLLEVACRRAWHDGGAAALDDAVARGLLAVAKARQELELEEEEEGGEEQGEGEEEDDEDGGEEQQQGEVPEDEQAEEPLDSICNRRLLTRLLADPASFLPAFRAAALYPTPRLPHSCAPNCREQLSEDGGMEMSVVTNRPGLGDSTAAARTVCRLEELSDSAQERADELAALGLLRPGSLCDCARCRFESGGEATAPELRTLIDVAKHGSRHKEALALLDELVRRDPKDGDALYWRARVTSWDDRWSQSHERMVAAAAVAPEHPLLRSTLDASLSYCGWCPPTTTPPDASARLSSGWSAVEGLDGDAFIAPGLLLRSECAAMVSAVEAQLQGNWTTSRHYAVPTTDVPVCKVPAVLSWFNQQLEHLIFPAMGRQFGVRAGSLRVIDAFVVRYSAAKQRALPLHCDQSQFSLTVALNDRAEYEGGGTFFAKTGEPANTDAGGVVSFRGSLMHSGHPILSGTRYILVAFIYSHLASASGKRKLDEVE